MRVLVLCGDQYHPAEDVMAGLTEPGFEFVEAPRLDSLEGFDAIVIAKMNVTSRADPTPWADAVAEGLISGFVQSGKGLLVVHAGTVGYNGAIRQMTGGAFLHHPEACEVTYVGSEHVLTVGVADFVVRDEHYFVDFDEGLDVFLTSHSASGGQPAGWTNTFGSGRICTLTPGHFSAVWQEAAFQALVGNALRWVTSG